jgi:hypothetical protein
MLTPDNDKEGTMALTVLLPLIHGGRVALTMPADPFRIETIREVLSDGTIHSTTWLVHPEGSARALVHDTWAEAGTAASGDARRLGSPGDNA